MYPIYENIYNKELYMLDPQVNSTKIIDGVEYITVIRIATQKEVMVRKDSIKEVQRKNVNKYVT